MPESSCNIDVVTDQLAVFLNKREIQDIAQTISANKTTNGYKIVTGLARKWNTEDNDHQNTLLKVKKAVFTLHPAEHEELVWSVLGFKVKRAWRRQRQNKT